MRWLLLILGINAVIFSLADTQLAEDAAILMRYVDNFASTGEIVYNIGEEPVDGATDLLPTILASILVKTGIATSTAIKIINFVENAK